MSKVLAPSTIGFKKQELSARADWGLKQFGLSNTWPYTWTTSMSYKGPLNRGDRRHATDYVRMVGRITSSAGKCANSKYAWDGKGQGCTVGLKANSIYGSSYATGAVQVPGWLVDEAVSSAKADIQQIGVNVLEDLGQLRQTGEGIADIVKTIRDLFLLIRRKKWKAARRIFRNIGYNLPRRVSNWWLAYFYGIKPLVGTIGALASSEKPLFKTLTVRRRSQTAADPYAYVDKGKTLGVRMSGTAYLQAQCQLTAQIKMQGNTASWFDLGVTDSSFTDAVVTAWALVPMSFVVDWFIPVEAWLRQLSWTSHLTYQDGFIGRRHVVDANFVDDYPWSFDGGIYLGETPKGSLQVRFYRREAYGFVPPMAAINLRLSLNPNQIISAAALIASRG